MRAKRLLGVLVGVLALMGCPAGMAQEYLDPPLPMIGQLVSNYDTLNMTSLKPAFKGDERVFATFQPAFSPEYVVGLRGGGASYRIFAAIPAFTKDGRRIHDSLGRVSPPLVGLDGKRLPKDEEDRILAGRRTSMTEVRLKECEIPVQKYLATKVLAAWDKVVLQTKFHDDVPRIGADGVFIQFASVLKHRVAAGVTWSPEPPGNPDKLATAAEAMYRLCFDPRGRDATGVWNEIRTSIAGIR